MSTVVSLETFAVGFAGFCCVFYGLLGISVVCTSNCEKSYVSDNSGANVQLTPAIASFYCSLAIIVGYILLKLRDTVGQVAGNVSTFGSQLRTKTSEGQEMRSFSVRFAVILTFVFIIVVVFMRIVLLAPLEKCEALDPAQAPFMFALRSTLKRMEFWVVGLGFFMLASGLIFSIVETWYREGYAKRNNPQAAEEEKYGWTTGVYDKYNQTKDQLKDGWGWTFGEKGVTLKATGENIQETRRAVANPATPANQGGNRPSSGQRTSPEVTYQPVAPTSTQPHPQRSASTAKGSTRSQSSASTTNGNTDVLHMRSGASKSSAQRGSSSESGQGSTSHPQSSAQRGSSSESSQGSTSHPQSSHGQTQPSPHSQGQQATRRNSM